LVGEWWRALGVEARSLLRAFGDVVVDVAAEEVMACQRMAGGDAVDVESP